MSRNSSESIETPTSCDHVEFRISQRENSMFFLPTPSMRRMVPLSPNGLRLSTNGLLRPSTDSLLPLLTDGLLPPSTNGLLRQRTPPSLDEWPPLDERWARPTTSMDGLLLLKNGGLLPRQTPSPTTSTNRLPPPSTNDGLLLPSTNGLPALMLSPPFPESWCWIQAWSFSNG